MCLFIFSIHFILTSTHPIYSTFALGNNDSPTTTKTMINQLILLSICSVSNATTSFLPLLPPVLLFPYRPSMSFFFLNKEIHFFKKAYLFLAALGLCCCAQVFSSWDEWGLQVAVLRLLTVVASLVVEHGR